MRSSIATLGALFCSLCLIGCVSREAKLYRVVDATDFHPIQGAQVWMQPWAPIHPFWPAAARGVTDDNGIVSLSLPTDSWFYFSGVKADGYSLVEDPEHPAPIPDGITIFGTFYMKRDPAESEAHEPPARRNLNG
jgi:hypothetical protein